MLCSVVCTNEDYGLGKFVLLLDSRIEAMAVADDMKLEVPTFIVLYFVVCAKGFSDVDPFICARCPRWNLTTLFLECICNQ